MERILITGGAGFIGSNFVHLMLQNGYEVLNFDKLSYASVPESLASLAKHTRYKFVEGDLASFESIRNTVMQYRPTAIVHMAAESHVDRSIDSPLPFLQSNIVGTFNLLESVREYCAPGTLGDSSDFRLLHVSTDEVFGSAKANESFTEETRYSPRSPYAASKAAADHLARAWNNTFTLPIIVTNCCNNYGPYQFPEKLIPLIILRAIAGETLPIYGTGKNIRDWLFVVDHCKALQAILERGKTGETYNIGAHETHSNSDVVRMICGILDEIHPKRDGSSYESQIAFVADRPGHDERYAINSTKIRNELGWRPTVDFKTGLRTTVGWYLDNTTWCQSALKRTYRLERLGLSEVKGKATSS